MLNMSGITRTGAIVVENRLDEIRIVRITFKILFCAEERTERVCMPYMEAHLQFRPDRLRRIVDTLVRRVLSVVPKFLPCKDLRIVHHNPPELHKITIGRTLSGSSLSDELSEPLVTRNCAIDIDSTVFGRLSMIPTETGGWMIPGIGADQVVQRTLLFCSPHDSIDVVGGAVIARHTQHEVSVVGVVCAASGAPLPLIIHFFQLFDLGCVGAEDIVIPRINLDSPLLCLR